MSNPGVALLLFLYAHSGFDDNNTNRSAIKINKH